MLKPRARARQAINEAGADRVGDIHEHDRHAARRLQQRRHSRCATSEDDVRRECGQFRRVLASVVGVAQAPAIIVPQVAADCPAQLLHSRRNAAAFACRVRIVRSAAAREHADAPHRFGLLRTRRERPRRRTAKTNAPWHSRSDTLSGRLPEPCRLRPVIPVTEDDGVRPLCSGPPPLHPWRKPASGKLAAPALAHGRPSWPTFPPMKPPLSPTPIWRGLRRRSGFTSTGCPTSAGRHGAATGCISMTGARRARRAARWCSSMAAAATVDCSRHLPRHWRQPGFAWSFPIFRDMD